MIDRFADEIVLVGRATVILLMLGSADEYGNRDQPIATSAVQDIKRKPGVKWLMVECLSS